MADRTPSRSPESGDVAIEQAGEDRAAQFEAEPAAPEAPPRSPVGPRLGAAIVVAALVVGAIAWFLISRSGGDTVEQVGPYEVEMTVEPEVPQNGERADFTFEVRRQDQPVGAGEINPSLFVDMPGMPMGMPRMPLESAGEGRWRGSVVFTMAGGWVAEVTLNSPETKEKATFDIEVAR